MSQSQHQVISQEALTASLWAKPSPGQCQKVFKNPQVNQEKVLTLLKKYEKLELLTEYLLIESLK